MAPSVTSEAGGAVSDDALFRDKLKHMGKCECCAGPVLAAWKGWRGAGSGVGRGRWYLALSQTHLFFEKSQPAFPTTWAASAGLQALGTLGGVGQSG